MNVFIVIYVSKGSQQAIAAFTGKDSADDYIRDESLSKTVFDLYDVPSELESPPEKLYVAHKTIVGNIHQVTGYYLQKFQAKLATGGGGFVTELNIDKPEPFEPPEETEEEAEKFAVPVAATGPELSTFKIICDRFGGLANVCILAFMISFIAVFNYVYYSIFKRIEFAENVASVKWLPDEATDISYYKDNSVWTFEFSISRAGFLEWANSEGFDVVEIDAPPAIKILRYAFDADKPLEGIENLSEKEQFRKWEAATKVNLNKGYTIQEILKDGTLITAGAYNTQAKRAYYRISSI